MALALSFKSGESVTIRTPEGREIQVMFRPYSGKVGRLYFAADKDVQILRDSISGKEFPEQLPETRNSARK